MAVRATWHTIRSPIGMTDAIMRAAPSIYNFAQSALRSQKKDKYRVPETRFNGRVSPQKMFEARRFPLDDLKAARAAVPGSTINDVILTVCGGALRRYLQHHEELPDDSLVAFVPINARPASSSDPDAPGNNITAMTAPIFTDVEDPLERLACIHEATQQSKAAKSGISARLMTDLSKHVPASTQVLASRLVLGAGLRNRLCNLFISNVPGPQVPLYMNGALPGRNLRHGAIGKRHGPVYCDAELQRPCDVQCHIHSRHHARYRFFRRLPGRIGRGTGLEDPASGEEAPEQEEDSRRQRLAVQRSALMSPRAVARISWRGATDGY